MSPIFMPQGPPSLKQLRSTTVSSLPPIDEVFLKNAPLSVYFLNLFHKINQAMEIGATAASKENVVMIEVIYGIHKDFRSAINALSKQIEALTEERSTLKNATPRRDTLTPIPFTLCVVAPERTAISDVRRVPLPTAAPSRSWATVASKGRSKKLPWLLVLPKPWES